LIEDARVILNNLEGWQVFFFFFNKYIVEKPKQNEVHIASKGRRISTGRSRNKEKKRREEDKGMLVECDPAAAQLGTEPGRRMGGPKQRKKKGGGRN
jgi:hypothetical protein